MCSGGFSRSNNASIVGKKSSATVQQIQPFASSIILSSSQPSIPHPANIARSIPKSPNSLIIKAMRLPPAFSNMCRINVVFPAPKNPVITVAGIFILFRPLKYLGFQRSPIQPDPKPQQLPDSFDPRNQQIFVPKHCQE